MSVAAADIATILELFEAVELPDPALVTVVHETHPSAESTVTLLTYKKHRYMLLQDDSVSGEHDEIQHIFEDEILIPSTGHVVQKPATGTDTPTYGLQYEDHQYYLWSYDKDE